MILITSWEKIFSRITPFLGWYMRPGELTWSVCLNNSFLDGATTFNRTTSSRLTIGKATIRTITLESSRVIILRRITLSRLTLSRMVLSTMTLSRKTLSRMTLSRMILSRMTVLYCTTECQFEYRLVKWRSDICHSPECRDTILWARSVFCNCIFNVWFCRLKTMVGIGKTSYDHRTKKIATWATKPLKLNLTCNDKVRQYVPQILREILRSL